MPLLLGNAGCTIRGQVGSFQSSSAADSKVKAAQTGLRLSLQNTGERESVVGDDRCSPVLDQINKTKPKTAAKT